MASRKPAGAVSVPGNKPKASGAKAGAKPGAKAAGGAKAATGAKKAVGAGTVAKKVAAPAKKAAPGAKKGTTAGGGATSRLTKAAGGAKGKSSAGGVTAKKKAGVSKKAAASKKGAPKETAEEREARTAREAAAVTITRLARGKLARLELGRRREAKAKRDEEMEELRAKAWLAQVEYERKQDAKRRKRDQEERARRKAKAKAEAAALEAAYDDEVAELEAALAAVDEATGRPLVGVEAEDASGNTGLSEAAAGGSAAAARLLLDLGADPNRRGQYGRTPLWRAAFMGKLELVHLLLAAGADPALANESGETPLSVGASDEIKDAIRSFDPVETGRLVEEFATRAAARKAEARAAATAEESKLEDALGAAERADGVAQRELKAARAELARLIEEHDLLQTEGKGERTAEITLQAIHDAEARVEEITSRAAETAEAKAAAARALEEERARMLGEDLPADGDGDDDGDDTLRVEIGKLNDLLLRDTQGLLKAAAPRWPLLIDPSGQSTVFLTYADTNFVQVCNPSATEPNKLRRGLLGAIRYGKPLVLDCMDVDMRDEIEAAFGRVEPGLFARLLDRSLLEGEAFLSLVHAADGDEYKAINFDPRRVDRFQLIVITRMRRPSDKMLDGMLPVRVAIGP